MWRLSEDGKSTGIRASPRPGGAALFRGSHHSRHPGDRGHRERIDGDRDGLSQRSHRHRDREAPHGAASTRSVAAAIAPQHLLWSWGSRSATADLTGKRGVVCQNDKEMWGAPRTRDIVNSCCTKSFSPKSLWHACCLGFVGGRWRSVRFPDGSVVQHRRTGVAPCRLGAE